VQAAQQALVWSTHLFITSAWQCLLQLWPAFLLSHTQAIVMSWRKVQGPAAGLRLPVSGGSSGGISDVIIHHGSGPGVETDDFTVPFYTRGTSLELCIALPPMSYR
jgi:hypothetical protein